MIVDCKHWKKGPKDATWGKCVLNQYGGMPSFGVCELVCELGKNLEKKRKKKKTSMGLGDTIAKATKAVGINPCKKCEERKEKLNKIFPYSKD